MKSTSFKAFLMVIVTTFAMTMANRNQGRNLYCRDRIGYFSTGHFRVSSCSLCYFYLIKDHPHYSLNQPLIFKEIHSTPYYLVNNESNSQHPVPVYPSRDDMSAINQVCLTLDDDKCNRWQSCCAAAWDCCQSQINSKHNADIGTFKICPQTFDGWLCWNSTKAGTNVSQPCPNFLSHVEVSGQSTKSCNSNATWLTDKQTSLEYTDYEACVQTDRNNLYQEAIILGLTLNVIEIVLLFPSIMIFMCNRGLRQQIRIQIHVNFFLALLLSSCFSLLWDINIRLNRLSSTEEKSNLYGHQGYCKSVHVLVNWSRVCTFFWMTCEGYFLHRLLVKAFIQPKHLYGYLLFGWALPSVLMITYAIGRLYSAYDSVCWLLPLEDANRAIEWVQVYAPTIACIIVNIVFLISILKQLLLKIVSHPNEPSTFRKAVRATFILIPLFGLQQFCLIYRPSPDQNTQFYVYEFVAAVITNSQGILISLIFCYCNNEVKGYIRNNFAKLKSRCTYDDKRDNRKMSVSTKSDSRKTSVSSLQIQQATSLYGSMMTGVGGVENEGFETSDIVETTSL